MVRTEDLDDSMFIISKEKMLDGLCSLYVGFLSRQEIIDRGLLEKAMLEQEKMHHGSIEVLR